MRKVALVLVLLAAASWIPGPDIALSSPQGGTITGVVKVRERSNDDESLLVAVTGATEKPVTRLEVNLPDRFSLRVGYVPQGWTAKVDGKQISASGPSAASVYLRFDASPKEQILRKLSGKRCRLRAWQNDELLYGIEHAILPDFKVGTQFTLDDALTAPPLVSIGDPFMAVPAPNFANGEWRLVLKDSDAADLSRLDSWKLKVTEQVFKRTETAPPTPTPLFGFAGKGLRFTYTDPFGETLIDSAPTWRTTLKKLACPTAMTGGSTLAFSGQQTCVTGCFDELGRAMQFLLDDTEPVQPRAISPSSIVLGIPPSVQPGPHTLSLREGKATLGTLRIRVLQMVGAIDQNQLWKGQSTTMRLDIVGHDQPVPIHVVNRTPAIITVDGGVRQTVTTAGGTPNGVTRSVRGIHKGDFAIDYSLNLPPCGLPQ